MDIWPTQLEHDENTEEIQLVNAASRQQSPV